MSLLGTCFNLARMIMLMGGVKPLITQLKKTQEIPHKGSLVKLGEEIDKLKKIPTTTRKYLTYQKENLIGGQHSALRPV